MKTFTKNLSVRRLCEVRRSQRETQGSSRHRCGWWFLTLWGFFAVSVGLRAAELQVVLRPPAVISQGGGWRLAGEADYRPSSTSVTLVAGTYAVEFEPVNGFATPNRKLVDVATGRRAIVAGQYGAAPGDPAARLPDLKLSRDGSVLTVVEQSDGQLIVGGIFSSIGGGARRNLARLHSDGTLDESWAPEPDGPVNDVLLMGDDVIVGGAFRTIGGVSRIGLAKVSLRGVGIGNKKWNTKLGRFAQPFGPYTPRVAASIAKLAGDGHMVYAFGTFSSAGDVSFPRYQDNSLIKINPETGVVDRAWTRHFQQEKTKRGISYFYDICVASNFLFLRTNAAENPDYDARVLRVSPATGLPDPTWRLPSGRHYSLATRGDYVYATSGNTVSRSSATGNGSPDLGWAPDFGQESVQAITEASADYIYVQTYAQEESVLRRVLSSTGEVDPAWRFEQAVGLPHGAQFSLSTAKGVLVSTNTPNAPSGSTYIARVSAADALMDRFFRMDARASDGSLGKFIVAPSGQIYVASLDLYSNGTDRQTGLSRFNPDGSLDKAWDPQINGVQGMAIDDHYLYVAGDFSTVGGLLRHGLARLPLDGNGELDAVWDPASSAGLHLDIFSSELLIAEGSLYFTATAPSLNATLHRASLSGAGTVDPNWSSGLEAAGRYNARSIVAADGWLFVSGEFPFDTGNKPAVPRNFLRVKLADGTPDLSWRAPLYDRDIGPSFLVTDGRSLYYNVLTFPTNYTDAESIRRLTLATGKVDAHWGCSLSGYLNDLKLAGDGVYVAGAFSAIDGVPRSGVARLLIDHGGHVDPHWNFVLDSEGNFSDSGAAGSVDCVQPAGNDLFVSGSFRAIYNRAVTGFALLPKLAPPVVRPSLTQASGFSVVSNPLNNRLSVTHFVFTAITGGTLRLAADGRDIGLGDFVSAEDAVAGFTFTPASPSNGPQQVTLVAALGEGLLSPDAEPATYSLNVLNQPPSFQFGTAQYYAREGMANVMLTVLKSGIGGGSVDYTTADGGAKAVSAAGGDYVAQAGTLVFAPGDLSKTVSIALTDDQVFRGDRIFTVNLLTPSAGALLGSPATATVQIIDNDAVGELGSSLVRSGLLPAPAGDSSLTVDLSPSDGGGQWRLASDFQWRTSGATVQGLAAGDFKVQFKPVNGFLEPEELLVAVPAGSSITESASYQMFGTSANGSLQVFIKPDGVAALSPDPHGQWRLEGEGETQWRETGTTVDGLPEGGYVVEFRPLNGYTAPVPLRAVVTANVTQLLTGSYTVAEGAAGGAPQPVAATDVATKEPYIYNGQIRSDAGFGSGVVVKERVVFTVAHVLFDDVELSNVTTVLWSPQKAYGDYEPAPLTPRGWYIFEGYSAQRQADNNPGVSTPASQTLDAAAMFFAGPAAHGQSGGYLSDVSGSDQWLASGREKMLVGYPVPGPDTGVAGTLYATAPGNYVFQAAGSDGVAATLSVHGFPGMSGGPLYVRGDDGSFYPAGVYLGGARQTLVRAIDNALVDLINRAETAASGGGNNVGGGIGLVSSGNVAGSFTQTLVGCNLSPISAVQAGARWRLAGENDFRASGQLVAVTPGTFVIQFKAASGFVTPADLTVAVAGGAKVIAKGRYTLPLLPPVFSGNLAQSGVAGEKFVYQLSASQSPSHFSATGLPAGLSLDEKSGSISGFPVAFGTTEVAVTASNSAGVGLAKIIISIQRSGTLTVNVSGAGSVSPGFLGSSMRGQGSQLQVRATPAKGAVFAGWTGDIPSTDRLLRFEMSESLTLTANFVPNPFPFVAGSYAGLALSELSLGRLQFRLRSTGAFSLRVEQAGGSSSLKGQLALDGGFTGVIETPEGERPIEFHVDFTGGTDRLLGSIQAGPETWQLTADRAVFDAISHPCPVAGRYTVAWPCDEAQRGQAKFPQGSGWGILVVSKAGILQMVGVMGDGSPASQGTLLSKTFQWPLYSAGTLAGFLTFDPRGGISGPVQFIRRVNSSLRYPDGFRGNSVAIGRSYVSPAPGRPALELPPAAPLDLTASDPALTLHKEATLGADNKFVFQPAGSDGLTLFVRTQDGRLRGNFTNSVGGSVSLSGVVLQGAARALGQFQVTREVGSLTIASP